MLNIRDTDEEYGNKKSGVLSLNQLVTSKMVILEARSSCWVNIFKALSSNVHYKAERSAKNLDQFKGGKLTVLPVRT